MGFCYSPLLLSGYPAPKSLGLPTDVPPSSRQSSVRYSFPNFYSLCWQCPAWRAPEQQRHEPLTAVTGSRETWAYIWENVAFFLRCVWRTCFPKQTGFIERKSVSFFPPRRCLVFDQTVILTTRLWSGPTLYTLGINRSVTQPTKPSPTETS